MTVNSITLPFAATQQRQSGELLCFQAEPVPPLSWPQGSVNGHTIQRPLWAVTANHRLSSFGLIEPLQLLDLPAQIVTW